MITKLEKKVREYVKDLQIFKTPGTPGLGTLRNPKITVEKEEHALYRSGVGMLLYLVKHTRPDIAIAVRDLSKALDCPSLAAYKKMFRVLKYVLDTRNLTLRVAPVDMDTDEWSIILEVIKRLGFQLLDLFFTLWVFQSAEVVRDRSQ